MGRWPVPMCGVGRGRLPQHSRFLSDLPLQDTLTGKLKSDLGIVVRTIQWWPGLERGSGHNGSEEDGNVTVNPSWVACAFEKKRGRRELALLALLSPHRSLSFLALPCLRSSPASVSFAVRKKGFWSHWISPLSLVRVLRLAQRSPDSLTTESRNCLWSPLGLSVSFETCALSP